MRTLRVLVVAIVVACGLSAVASTPSTAAPPPAPWTVASYFSRLGTTLDRVSCSSTTRCTAIEAGLLMTTADGGTTWTDETALVPADAAELTDVSCPTDTRCYLAAVVGSGTAVVYVVDGGALSITSPVGAAGLLPTLDCTAADACFTTDGSSLFQTTDGGATWTARALATALEPVATVQARFNADFAGRATALSCAPGTVRCAVLGNVGITVVAQYTADAGQHWTTQTLSGNTSHPNGMVSVDCVSSTTCFALTAAPYDPTSIVVTSDGGGSWHSVPTSSRPTGWVVSCGAPTSCATVGGGSAWGFDVPDGSTFAATNDGGTTWTAGVAVGQPTVRQPAVACPTASACVVVSDGSAARSADGGATWTTVELPAAVRAVQSLSCATPTSCVGVEWLDWAHHVAVRGAPGGPWTRSELPTTPQAALRDLDCPSAKVCVASALPVVNGDRTGPGEVVSTVDGGVTWTTGGPIDIAATDLSCPTATTCLASTNYVHRVRATTNGGRTWVKVAAPPGVKTMLAVSCSSTTSCVALGTSAGHPPAATAWTTADLGATWVQRDLPHGGGDVDCNGSLCVVSWDLRYRVITRSTDGGATWTSVPSPSGIPYGLYQVSCGSPTTCATTGTDAIGTDVTGNQFVVSTRDAGSSWQVHSLPPQFAHPYPILSNVSCTRTACFVAGTDPYGRPTLFTGKA